MEEDIKRISKDKFIEGVENEDDKNLLLDKFKDIDEEKVVDIESNRLLYYAGVRRLYHLIEKFNSLDKIEFWKEVKVSELIFDINNVRIITSLLIKFFFLLDCEVIALDLIVKEYFNKINERIKRLK